MKKAKVVPGLAETLAGLFLVLVFLVAQGGWAQDTVSTQTPAGQPAVKTGSPKTSSPKNLKKKAVKETAPAQENENAQSAEDSKSLAHFVGAETCITCHQDNGNSILHSTHGRLMEVRKGIPFDKSCETCHGPGSLHVDFADNTTTAEFNSIKFPPKLKAPEANAICLTCHEAKSHFHWKGSPHDLKDVTCISCHTIHQDLKKPNAHLLKKPRIAEVCFTCHIEKKAQISRSAHMPLNEGDMSCTSCHDMHGTSGVRNLKGDSVNETCFKCHADKRGPFLWEHPPVAENCLSCHNPHGSANGKMLVQKPPQLCSRCHTRDHAGSVDDLTRLKAGNNHFIGKACLNCHTNIHGSNHPSGHAFQR